MTSLWLTFQAFSVLIGLVIGSFVSLCITRMPEDRSIVFPGSHCDTCGHAVRPKDNIPVLSWVLLRGRCRDCGAGIPVTYPLIEVFVGLLAWLLFRRLIPDFEALDLAHGLAWVVFFTFLCLLTIAAFIDLRHHIIPDETSIWAVPVGIAGAALLQWAGYDGWMSIGWRAATIGALLGGGFFGLVGMAAYGLSGRESLGWGDVKLVAMIGAFLGPMPGLLFVMMLGSVSGSIIALAAMLYLQRRPMLPFGPALAGAAMVYLFYGDVLIRAFLPTLAMWL